MGKTIFITEKPSVAQEYRKVLKVNQQGKTNGYIEGYSSALGKDVIITWAVGHLITMGKPEEQNEEWKTWNVKNLPMIPDTYKYKPNSATYDQYKVVKEQYTRKDIDAIYYAGDSGREGIYIQALIRNQIFKTAPKFDERVVWIDSYTEESILNGIKDAKPYSAYQNMIDSGYERARRDWLIGMNFTEAFTLKYGGYKNVLNTGRVKTPTLNLIVERQKEIDNFTKQDFYGVTTDEKLNWKATKDSKFYESPLLYNENGFLKEADAKALIDDLDKDKRLIVQDVKVQNKTEYAPLLYNLADLQNYCSKTYHISPDNALKIAQSLYEKKLTTYPRTDARVLSSAVATELKQKFGYNIPKKYIDDSKITDHYAIIPTFSKEGSTSGLNDLELKVYNAIKKRFEDTMKPPFVYDAVSVEYRHNNGERFFESFRIVKDKGYKDNLNDLDDVANKPVPEKGKIINVGSFDVRAMETKAPTPYTTGTLIMAMEKAGKFIEDEELREQIKTCGIGTSATRASIIEELQKQDFITVDKSQKVAPTEKGKALIEIVAQYDEALVNPLKTAEMEQQLSDIADGKVSVDTARSSFEDYVRSTTKSICNDEKKVSVAVPTVQANKDASGKVREQHSYDCPCCKKSLKQGKFGYWCPKNDGGCGLSLNYEAKNKEGKLLYKLSDKDIADICSKGQTGVKKLKSPKTGNPYEASLKINKETCRLEFEFPQKDKKDYGHDR